MEELAKIIDALEDMRADRTAERKHAAELENKDMTIYLSGRKDELDLISGMVYKMMYNQQKKMI